MSRPRPYAVPACDVCGRRISPSPSTLLRRSHRVQETAVNPVAPRCPGSGQKIEGLR